MKIESTKPKKEKLTPCPYCGRPLRNKRCENCKKDYLSQTAETTPNEMDPTTFISEDEVVGIKFLNEAKEEAKTEEERERFFFRFSPHVENMKLLVAVRFNEILWSFGLWHEFEIGERYRRDKEISEATT